MSGGCRVDLYKTTVKRNKTTVRRHPALLQSLNHGMRLTASGGSCLLGRRCALLLLQHCWREPEARESTDRKAHSPKSAQRSCAPALLTSPRPWPSVACGGLLARLSARTRKGTKTGLFSCFGDTITLYCFRCAAQRHRSLSR